MCAFKHAAGVYKFRGRVSYEGSESRGEMFEEGSTEI